MSFRVPLRNNFLRDEGAIQIKSPTTKRYSHVLDKKKKSNGILNLTIENEHDTNEFSK